MKHKNYAFIIIILCAIPLLANAVRLKDVVRIQEVKEISLIGYGLVIGLGGSGDSSKNKMTIQSLKNTLSRFGLVLDDKDISSRNIAAVMITAKISSFGEQGDHFDIAVSSIGDARSLTGGTLVLTPMYGINEKIYAFAQGQLTVGGYDFEKDNNSYTKNHATVGKVIEGATLERAMSDADVEGKIVNVILKNPDYTTASKMVSAIQSSGIAGSVEAIHPGKISVSIPNGVSKIDFISRLENISVAPDAIGRVVINERTGTIVAGSNVILGAVSIAHGNLKIEVDTKYKASQPGNGFAYGDGVKSLLVPDVNLSVQEEEGVPISLPDGTTVSDLVAALHKINLSTRDIISIFQSIKTAGALHADLIIE